MAPSKYKKKPVRIEAEQLTLENATSVAFWCGGTLEGTNSLDTVIKIPTLGGIVTAQIGDFIIKGVKGEFYFHTSSVFLASYEPVAP